MSITISGNGIVEANLADNAVTLAKMASGTDGEILTYDASGNPTAVSVGTDGQVLTSTGAGSPPAFETAAGGGKVLQLQYTRWTSMASFAGTTSFAEVSTGLRVAITPTSTSNKIILEAFIPASSGGGYLYGFQFYDVTGGAVVEPSTETAGNRHRATVGYRLWYADANDQGIIHIRQIITAPRTSSTTYTVYGKAEASITVYLNHDNANNASFGFTGVSTVSAMEVE